MYKRLGLSGLAVLGLMAGAAAYAETQPGFYAGAGIGQSSIEAGGADDSDTAFKVFGGYSFNDHFAVELAYIDGGGVEGSFGSTSFEVEVAGLAASAVGRLPINETFSVFGKIGLASFDTDITISDPFFGTISGSVSDDEVMYGIGAALGFGAFEMRAEYEAVDVAGGDFTLLSVNGMFRF